MLSIENIYLSDSVEEAQFEKVNLLGLNLTNSIFVETLPYMLVSHMVISGWTDEHPDNLSMEIILESSGNILLHQKHKIETGEEKVEIEEAEPLILVIPVNLLLESEGNLQLRIIRDKEDIFVKDYVIKIGSSPLLKNVKHTAYSQIFKGKPHDIEFVKDLLGTARESVKIFDSYIDPSSLLEIFSKVDSNIKIEVLTSQPRNRRRQYSVVNNEFISQYPNSQIKFSRASHDRFIIINDTECYHFGHSLKDVAGGKVSRFSKITRKDEVEELINFFDTEWTN